MKNHTTTAYPVYTGSLDKFTLMPYSFVAEDTVTMHFKMDHLKKHVAETLADRHYTAVLLTLEKDGQTFQTTALFNTETGELEYDNILFNLITAEVRSSEDAPRLLTAAEGMNTNGSLVNGTLVTFYINSVSTVLGYAGINWAVYGSYSNINDTVYYHHSRIDHQMVGWTAGVSAYAPLIYRTGLEDMSGSDHTLFRMYVWIGPYDMVPNEYDIWEGLSVGTTRINDTSYTR